MLYLRAHIRAVCVRSNTLSPVEQTVFSHAHIIGGFALTYNDSQSTIYLHLKSGQVHHTNLDVLVICYRITIKNTYHFTLKGISETRIGLPYRRTIGTANNRWSMQINITR